MELSQDQLKKELHYNPETGVFTRKIANANSGSIGDIAGCIDKTRGYVRFRVNYKHYYAHRLAWFYMKGYWPKQIDHIDHVKTNNAFSNLRGVAHLENMKNKTMSCNNISGVSGVHWNKRDEKWQSNINKKGKKLFLGYFNDWFEAVCARKSAEFKYNYHVNHGANN